LSGKILIGASKKVAATKNKNRLTKRQDGYGTPMKN